MDKLTFYFDRTFGKQLPLLLSRVRRAPFEVKYHNGEGYPKDMPDDEWLAHAGSQGWVVLTQDYKFHLPRFEHEMAALKLHRVRCFYFPCAEETVWEALCTFTKNYQRLLSKLDGSGPCFIYRLSKAGRFKRIFDEGSDAK